VTELMAVNGETYSIAVAGPMHRMDGALKRHAKLLTGLRAALERDAQIVPKSRRNKSR
jgi:hypothetical protein